jgi:transposase
MSGSLAELTRKVADLTARVAELEQENAALHQLIAAYKQAIYGQSSERVDPKQADLDLGDIDANAPLPTPANDDDGGQDDDKPKAPRRGGQARRNRGALPRHLPRKHVHLEPETDSCPCCSGALHKIGEDIRELLDVVPALYRVLCIHRARYGCRTCSSAVVQAPAPEQPVEGGYATCTLIARIAVGKWAWHLPLYRQSKMLAGQGIIIDRSTLASWMARAAWWLRPLHERLLKAVLAQQRVYCDDTPLPVLAPGTGRTKTGRFWAYAIDDRSWSGPAPPAVAYLYAEDRKARHMTDHLKSFTGILQVDGYQGYGQLADREALPITLAYCLAHARRKFHKVHLTTGSPIAQEALRRIAEIYAIEARVRGTTAAERRAVRQAESAPRMADLKAWLMARLGEISQQSGLAKAIRYTLGHWDGLCAFLADGRIEVDSNTVEQQMRPVALGRRNSLFAGSEGGAETWAILASLIQTAKLNDLDPLTYLADVLQRIVDGSVPVNRLEELLPWNWTAAEVAQAA